MDTEPKEQRGVVNLPPALMRAYSEAAASTGQRPAVLAVGFIEWWMGSGPAPTRPDWEAAITDWSDRTSLSFPMPPGEWARFGELAERNGYTRAELVIRFIRWFVGLDRLPFPAAPQVGNNRQE